jgi:hypothetical protein
MMLIAVMYFNESILISILWYLSWLAYIKYGGSPLAAMAVFFETQDAPLKARNLIAVTNLIAIIRLGLADSILVLIILTYNDPSGDT